ncbi:hypothetical protein BH11PLA1_BH11PLA1_10500 [soil metagenome]
MTMDKHTTRTAAIPAAGAHKFPLATAGVRLSLAQMFELASLDAMGLLEEGERRAFDETFATLAPEIQAQLRTQQTLASGAIELPDVAAPEGLRPRVLSAVMRQVTSAGTTLSLRNAGPRLVKALGVNPIWRAAAIGCAAASIALGYAAMQMASEYRTLERLIAGNVVNDVFVKEFGPRFESVLMNSKTQFIQFAASAQVASVEGQSLPSAVILVDPQTRTAQLFCRDLPANGQAYNLVLVDSSGHVGAVLLPFRSSGPRATAQIGNLEIGSGMTLAIVAEGGDENYLLRSTNL